MLKKSESPSETFIAAPELASKLDLPSKFAADQLVEALQSPVKSQRDLDRLKSLISDYVQFLPGPLTPQKYSGLDCDVEIDDFVYGLVLEYLVETFDSNWPIQNDVLDPLVKRIFIVDGCSITMLNEILTILIRALKEMKQEKKFIVVKILEEIVRSDMILSAILTVSQSSKEKNFQKQIAAETWESTVQLLVSLSNRVANELQFKFPTIFRPKDYANLMTYQLSRALLFLNEAKQNVSFEVDQTFLVAFVNKFAVLANQDDLVPFVEIIIDCSTSDPAGKILIQSLLTSLDRRAVENIGLLILKLSNSHFDVYEILGEILSNDLWNYTLLTKIPMMCWFDDDKIAVNLVGYLSRVKNPSYFVGFCHRLLGIWGDRSALNHAPFSQHLYLTKLLILSIKEIRNILKPEDKQKLKSSTLSGISVHLESTSAEVRVSGMVTGSILIESLNEPDEPKLEFDFDSFSLNEKETVSKLRSLEVPKSGFEKEKEQLVFENVEFPSSLSKQIYNLGVVCEILPALNKINLPKEHQNIPENEPEKSEKSIEKIELELKKKQEELELDSDDDLEPYDMSNDTPISERLRPVYLRDFHENLINPELNVKSDLITESMQCCESLILAQLPDDDSSFAVQLLALLSTYIPNCYVENFNKLAFSACASIVTIFPKECAEFLCREFHSKLGSYSIQQSVTFLIILAEAARRLSAVSTEPELEKQNTKQEKNMKTKPEKSEKRVSLLFETDKTKMSKEFLIDDWEDLVERQETNWETVIRERITQKTRVFAHKSKVAKTTLNKFNDVASYFFYPLLYGFGRKGTSMYEIPHSFADQGNLLLINFLKTLAALMLAAQNCTIVTKMGKEIFELVWVLKYHEDAKVRLCVIENVACVVTVVPVEMLVAELSDSLMEIREWLHTISYNLIKGDPDEKCRKLGEQVLSMIETILSSNF